MSIIKIQIFDIDNYKNKTYNKVKIKNMNTNNIILMGDFYKITHWKQYPKDTEIVYSYLESRGGEFDYTVFFGLQYFIKRYLIGSVVTMDMIDEAEKFCSKGFGTNTLFNRAGWERIVKIHGGKLPIKIKAVPEGMKIDVKNVLMTMENTDEQLPWLTNFLETLLLQVWYPITVASLSANIKDTIQEFANMSSDVGVSPFHLNDFGARGCSSQETAGIGGMAHLVNFLGTDTMRGVQFAMEYYNTDVCGHSVMATEHSTTTIYGRENEEEAYKRFLDECPTGILSVVSDSYNIYEAIKMFGTKFKEQILARDGKFVVRPDSGDPCVMSVEVLNLLWEYFGGTRNEKGYRVLNPKVGMIYGDGINYGSIRQIMWNVTINGFSTDNIVLGCGGGLLQQIDRDTLKFAIKCCAAKRDGKWVEVYKDPITDKGKGSKKGRLKLIRNEVGFKTVNEDVDGDDILQVVFENGEIKREYTFDQIRENVK